MSYQVLARKWRPQTFREVVGQPTVTRSLENAIKGGRIAHAFLFSGVRGVGKTSTARILAKALNCQRELAPEPCGECDSCLEIAASNSMDVLEIDAASNTGVDNIRELRESVQYGTARDRFRIFIIDEVHMLSNQAFNALLKTLEEPPGHVKFILATTEHHKIPVTITSRCQQFDFKPIPFPVLLDRLQLICREEEIEAGSYSLRAIASAAQGSMRDAQSTLDQLISFCGRKITDEDARVLLGVVDEKVVSGIVNALLERDREGLLQHAQDLAESGLDPLNFCRKFITYLRNLLVCRVAGWNERLLQLPDTDKELLLAQAQRFSELDLIRLYDLLTRTETELRTHPYPYIHLEMTLLKTVELAELPRVEELIRRLESGDLSKALPPSPPRPATSAGQPRAGKQETPTARPSDKSAESSSEPVDNTSKPQAAAGSRRPSIPDSQVVSRMMGALQDRSMRLYSSLEHAARIQYGEGRLAVEFEPSQSIHCSTVKETENLQILAEVTGSLTGGSVNVEVELAADKGSASRQDPTQDPGVQVFLKAFPGKYIVDKEN